jgi:hypothetical protein
MNQMILRQDYSTQKHLGYKVVQLGIQQVLQRMTQMNSCAKRKISYLSLVADPAAHRFLAPFQAVDACRHIHMLSSWLKLTKLIKSTSSLTMQKLPQP